MTEDKKEDLRRQLTPERKQKLAEGRRRYYAMLRRNRGGQRPAADQSLSGRIRNLRAEAHDLVQRTRRLEKLIRETL